MEVSALIVGAIAGIATGLTVKNRSRRVRIGVTILHAYVVLILVVLAIAFTRMNSS